MRTRTEMFGDYHVSILGVGVAITITNREGREVFLQGDEAVTLTDVYDALDLGGDPCSAHLHERQTADDLFGEYFD